MSEKKEEEELVDIDKDDEETPSPEEDKAADDDSGSKPKPSDDDGDYFKLVARLSTEQKGHFGMIMAAIIQLIAITAPELKTSYVYAYGIALGSITLIFALIGLALSFIQSIDPKAKVYLGYFLFFWNFIGACFMTFGDYAPFPNTGNGYFGAWGMALFSILVVGISFDEAKHSVTGMGPQLGLLVSSLVVMVASAAILADGRDFWRNDQPYNIAIFAVTLSSITVIAMGLFIFFGMKREEGSKPNPIMFLLLVCLCISWIFEAFFSTFRGPFQNTGNGYFGSWGAAFSALFATVAGAKSLMKKE